MTKKSKKRHIGSLGGGENVEHKSDRRAKKRKFNFLGTNTGAIRTPRSGIATPSKTSCGNAVSSVMPSGKRTPNAVPTSSSGKGGEQQKQQDQQLSAVPKGARKESYDVSTSRPSDGNRASGVAENAQFNPDRPYKVAKKKSNKRARRSRLRDPEISLLDNESTGSAHPQDDAHSKAAKKVEKADDAPPFETTSPSANQTPAKMLPRHSTSASAPAITAVLTETTQDHELHPPAGRGRRQRKKLKHRNELTLAASSPMLSRTVSRQSAIATPTGQRPAPSARNSIDPELGVRLPEPPHGLNEHQRKLWTDRVRRVTLEILTPGKAAQSGTVEAARGLQPGTLPEAASSTSIASLRESDLQSAKVKNSELWRQATTTTLVAAPQKQWICAHEKFSAASIHGMRLQAESSADQHATSASAGTRLAVEDREHAFGPLARDDQIRGSKKDTFAPKAESLEPDEGTRASSEMNAGASEQKKTREPQTAQVQEAVQAQDEDDGTSSLQSESELSGDASEATDIAATVAALREASRGHKDATSHEGSRGPPAAEDVQLSRASEPLSSPVSFDDDQESDSSHEEDVASNEEIKPCAEILNAVESFPSSAPMPTHLKSSQSIMLPSINDSEDLDSDLPTDLQSPPRIKFSSKSFKLGNAANALGYSVKPAMKDSYAPKAAQIDARDAFRRFSSFVEGSDSEDSDGSDSDDASQKSGGSKSRQSGAAAATSSQVSAQKTLSSKVIPDSQSGNGLQLRQAVTSFAAEPIPTVVAKSGAVSADQDDANEDEDESEDSGYEDEGTGDIEAEDDSDDACDEQRLDVSEETSLTGAAASRGAARRNEAPDAASDSDSYRESDPDEEEDEDRASDKQSDASDDDDGEVSTAQEIGAGSPPTPGVNGHQDVDQAQRPQRRGTGQETRQEQRRKTTPAETKILEFVHNEGGSSSDREVSDQDSDDGKRDSVNHGPHRLNTMAEAVEADEADFANNGPGNEDDSANKLALQPSTSWSFGAIAEIDNTAEIQNASADLDAAKQKVGEPEDGIEEDRATEDDKPDVVSAGLTAESAMDTADVDANVHGLGDEEMSRVDEDEGSAGSDLDEEEEQEKDQEEEDGEEPATTEEAGRVHSNDDKQSPAAHHGQSLYTTASQPEWQKITDEKVKAQLLGEMAAASYSGDPTRIEGADDHAHERGRKPALDRGMGEDVAMGEDDAGDLDAQSVDADMSPVYTRELSGFTAINTGAQHLPKVQPASTGKLKRPSVFLGHRSGGTGSGRARAFDGIDSRVVSSPTIVKGPSFTFGDNEDHELDESISEIQRDVFDSTTALPFSMDLSGDREQHLTDRAHGNSNIGSADLGHQGGKTWRQVMQVAIPPAQPEDYNMLVYSADVPEPSPIAASGSGEPEQAATDPEPSQSKKPRQAANGSQPSSAIGSATDQSPKAPNLNPRDPNDPLENELKCYGCARDGRRCLKPVTGGSVSRCRHCLSKKGSCVSYAEGLRRAQMRKKPEKKANGQPKGQVIAKPEVKPKKKPQEKTDEKLEQEPEERLVDQPEQEPEKQPMKPLTDTITEQEIEVTEWTTADVADKCYGCASRGQNCYKPPRGHEDQRCKACKYRKRPCRTYEEGREIASQRQAAKQQKELAALQFDDVDAGVATGESGPADEIVQPDASAAQEALIDDVNAMPPPAKSRKRKTTGMTSKHFTPEKRPKRNNAVVARERRQSVDFDVSTVHSEDVSAAAREEETGEQIILPQKLPKARSKSTGTKSPHFLPLHLLDRVDIPAPSEGRLPAGVSRAPVPPIASERFGIIQEKLWHEPFWLIIAVIFLNRTAGRAAAPTFWKLKEQYKTPEALAEAEQDELHDMIQHLGLQNQRARRLLAISKAWVESPPVAGVRHKTQNYPAHGDHAEHQTHPKGTPIEGDVENCKGALEIGHIPGCGPYAWDSWRIFCRDVLRGVAEDYNGKGAADESFEPEWKRVLPLDKELVAALRWMWLREGWIWDSKTGSKRRATEEEMERAEKGEMEVADPQEGKFAARAVGEENVYDAAVDQQDQGKKDAGADPDDDEAGGMAVNQAESSDTDVPAKPKRKAGRKGRSGHQ